tara:strand:- start:55 stop:462 length:408 start_codon:yes stop_codon:yes gene_type:complete
MQRIHSKIDKNKLLHALHRFADFNGRQNVSPDEQFLQLATIQNEKGVKYKPHQHIWKKGEEKVIAQESWIVAKGKIRVFYYDTDGSLLSTEDLGQGDCSITYEGGHTYMALEEDTFVYENKVGPYKGIENDKKLL